MAYAASRCVLRQKLDGVSTSRRIIQGRSQQCLWKVLWQALSAWPIRPKALFPPVYDPNAERARWLAVYQPRLRFPGRSLLPA